MAVRKILISAEKVLQEGNVLAQPGVLPEGGGSFRIVLSIHVPHLGFQGVDTVLACHEVNKAAAQIGAQVPHLMLRVQADHRFTGLQHIADQQLQQEALALAGVAKDEHTGVGLVLRTAVQVYDDIAAVLVLADVKALRVRLSGVVVGIEIRHGGRGQHPLELRSEDIAPCRIGAEKSLSLFEQEAVHGDLGAHQFAGHLVPQGAEALQILCRQIQIHRAVIQRFPVAVHGGHQRGHVLEVGLRCDALLHVVGVAALETAAVAGVLDDLLLLRTGDAPGINGDIYAAALSQIAQERQLLGNGGVAPHCHDAVVRIAQDEVVRVEFHRSRGDHVQEVLGQRLRHRFSLFLLRFLRHLHLPTFLRRNCQRHPWSHPAGSRRPAAA